MRPISDRVRLTGLEVHAHHGVIPEEGEAGQRFLVDVEVDLDLGPALASDDLGATLDYGVLARRIVERITGERWNLIESVAGRVADLVLDDGRVSAVTVTVHKPDAPVGVAVDDVSVTLTRRR